MLTEKRKTIVKRRIYGERRAILRQLEDWLEMPMVVLSLIWLVLFIVEAVRGLSPLLENIGMAIWIIFIVDFAVKFLLAPEKIEYLKRNWLTAIALALPALRVFRIFRALRILRFARAARGLRLVRLLTSLNRGMRALGASLGRRGFGYVMILSTIVLFGGAAGMFAFENRAEGGAFESYGDALWWTAMMLTTVGSDYFPVTAEGRVLCFILAIYAFAVFGYITATLATFFVESDTKERAERKSDAAALANLQTEIGELRAEIRQLLAGQGKQF
jgi:voltage-gated potassium channel